MIFNLGVGVITYEISSNLAGWYFERVSQRLRVSLSTHGQSAKSRARQASRNYQGLRHLFKALKVLGLYTKYRKLRIKASDPFRGILFEDRNRTLVVSCKGYYRRSSSSIKIILQIHSLRKVRNYRFIFLRQH